jgi:hypothetical protein
MARRDELSRGKLMEPSTQSFDEIESAVSMLLKLPGEIRLAISERLCEGVPPQIDDKLIAEYERRLDDAIKGREPLLERSESFDRVRKSTY